MWGKNGSRFIKITILDFRYLCWKTAITLDDAPMRGMSLYSGDERADKLIKTLDYGLEE